MRSPHQLRIALLASSLVIPVAAFAGQEISVRRIALTSANPFQLQIQTSGPVTPQTQIVSSPERLVIDIPNASPGPALHGMKINQGDVQGVRVGLFSTAPQVTRVVVDLNKPQWYRVTPTASGLLVSLGSDAENPVDTQATIGWVSTRSASAPATAQGASFEVRKGTAKHADTRKSPSVEFANGLMTIHSAGATLSEILFLIQKTTGAEIAIPSGTEQERVAEDFGPGSASEVLGQLLNGSGLNFVVVGSEADPNQLRSVILSPKQPGLEPTPAMVQAYTPPAVVESAEPENVDVVPAPAQPDEHGPQENAPAPGQNSGPPPDPPPTQ